ncbi:hypothetical protein REC12_24490 [Desulfosporosinus sp. PR]|uniref:phage late control D family protein n=1 Tax=Candidatus Desulfosporosinus nitrosoreducens TaxID=3401928 RepID=UPI0027FD0787|nr:hypothetical protein [Desulfosporosinus sp. PR]MDQ7096756.1 hypothetical protein [Desulfosporosinus sp. PR]
MASFSDFEEKYKGFQRPRFALKVDNEEIKMEEFPIIDISALMSADFGMSTCHFVIAGIFDFANSKFKHDIFETFKPGKVVDLKMGYNDPTNLQGVFKGYINSLKFDVNARGMHAIVECLDAKGALVNNKVWENYGDMGVADIVTSILNKYCKNYATVQSVEYDFNKGVSKDDISAEINKNQDYYHFLMCLAKKVRNSFCVIYDQIYFGPSLAQKKQDPAVELAWGKSLLSFHAEIHLTNQIGSVEVNWNDYDTQVTSTSKANIDGSPLGGSALPDVIKNKTKQINDRNILNKDQADELAKSELAASSANLVNCSGSTIGIPDIKAGSKIKISGMGKGIDGEFFLNEVTHSINGNGYLTEFKASSSCVAT